MTTYPNYLVTNTGPNRAQLRRASARTSSSKRTKAGIKMRSKALHTYPAVIAYREGINTLFRRLGILSSL